MRWIRRNKVKAAGAAAAAIGAVIMLFALSQLLFGGSDVTAGPRTGASSLPSIDVQEYTGTTTGDLGLADQPAGAGSGPGGFPGAGALQLDGLKGKGGILSLPKERITLSMTSAAPIGYVGYIVPTSLDNSTGTVKDPGTSWSLSTIGYGPPDYAQLFSIAGPTGVPVTCTITVNGKVTETRTTSGPYDQLFCQG